MSANYESCPPGDFGFSTNYETKETTMGHAPTRDKDRYGIANTPRPKMQSCKAPMSHCEEPVRFSVRPKGIVAYPVCKGHAMAALSDDNIMSIVRL